MPPKRRGNKTCSESEKNSEDTASKESASAESQKTTSTEQLKEKSEREKSEPESSDTQSLPVAESKVQNLSHSEDAASKESASIESRKRRKPRKKPSRRKTKSDSSVTQSLRVAESEVKNLSHSEGAASKESASSESRKATTSTKQSTWERRRGNSEPVLSVTQSLAGDQSQVQNPSNAVSIDLISQAIATIELRVARDQLQSLLSPFKVDSCHSRNKKQKPSKLPKHQRQAAKMESQVERDLRRMFPPDNSETNTSDTVNEEVLEVHGHGDISFKTELEIDSNRGAENTGDFVQISSITRGKSSEANTLQRTTIGSELFDSENIKPLDSDCKAVDEVTQPNLHLHKESNKEFVTSDAENRESIHFSGHVGYTDRPVIDTENKNRKETDEGFTPLIQEEKVESLKERDEAERKHSSDTSEKDAVPTAVIKEGQGLDSSFIEAESKNIKVIDDDITPPSQDEKVESQKEAERKHSSDTTEKDAVPTSAIKEAHGLDSSFIKAESKKIKAIDYDISPPSQEEKVESQKEAERKHSSDSSEKDAVPTAAIMEGHELDRSDEYFTYVAEGEFLDFGISENEFENFFNPESQNTENFSENEKTSSDSYSKADSRQPTLLAEDNSTATDKLQESSEVMDSKNIQQLDSDSDSKDMGEVTKPESLPQKESNQDVTENVALVTKTSSATDSIEKLESICEEFLTTLQTACDKFENNFMKCLKKEK